MQKKCLLVAVSTMLALSGSALGQALCIPKQSNMRSTVTSFYTLVIDPQDWALVEGTGRVEASAAVTSDYNNGTFDECELPDSNCSDSDVGLGDDSGLVDLMIGTAFASSTATLSTCPLSSAYASCHGTVAALNTSWDFVTTSGLNAIAWYHRDEFGDHYNGVESGRALAGNALTVQAYRLFGGAENTTPPDIYRTLEVNMEFRFDPESEDVGVAYIYYPALPAAFGTSAALVTWDPVMDQIVVQGLFDNEEIEVSESSGVVTIVGSITVVESLSDIHPSFNDNFNETDRR